MRVDKIYLVGFMGAGKSSVGAALSRRVGWPLIDIDHTIEAQERRTIADIFARDGELIFRELERRVLLAHLPTRHLIVSTGGGTFAETENRALINRDGASIWLDISFETVIERLPPDGRRPLAVDRAAMRLLYDMRLAAYEEAHLRLPADRASVDELVERILDWAEY